MPQPTDTMTDTRQRSKKQAAIDLHQLHGICEANYARMLRLFPRYETCNEREFMVGTAKVCLQVLERCRYTTVFRITQQQPEAQWLGLLSAEVRAYHDASMLEVFAFQSHRQAAARYAYPNAQMHQQDEKFQQNAFLAQWLEHCLQSGRSMQPLNIAVPGT